MATGLDLIRYKFDKVKWKAASSFWHMIDLSAFFSYTYAIATVVCNFMLFVILWHFFIPCDGIVQWISIAWFSGIWWFNILHGRELCATNQCRKQFFLTTRVRVFPLIFSPFSGLFKWKWSETHREINQDYVLTQNNNQKFLLCWKINERSSEIDCQIDTNSAPFKATIKMSKSRVPSNYPA